MEACKEGVERACVHELQARPRPAGTMGPHCGPCCFLCLGPTIDSRCSQIGGCSQSEAMLSPLTLSQRQSRQRQWLLPSTQVTACISSHAPTSAPDVPYLPACSIFHQPRGKIYTAEAAYQGRLLPFPIEKTHPRSIASASATLAITTVNQADTARHVQVCD